MMVRVRCHICGVKKNWHNWNELLAHVRGHIERREHRSLPKGGVCGELVGTSEGGGE